VEAYERLQREPERTCEAVSALLIGVTQFFREPDVFSYLDQVVLPKLSTGGVRLRVWSAGCADGAELYSVAMLLAGRGLLGASTLLGTDCRVDAVCQAQRGWFDCSRVLPLDERIRQTYFVPQQRGWQVRNAIRQATLWQQGDALAEPAAGEPSWDLILCRNLAIYLEPAAAARLWTVLAGSLRVGGVLVVGKAERPQRQLSLLPLAPCVFEKRGVSR
jgi:chemotaxis methyl-accepting protein methylase